MKKIFNKEFAIGLSVIVAILILIFGIDYLKGINLFRPAHYYIAYYDNVDELTVSSPVLINGYKVGQVREVNFDYTRPGKVEVVMALDKNLKLPAGTRADIGTTLLSGARIELAMGKGPDLLPSGSELETGVKAGLMNSVQDGLMPAITGILPKVDSLLYNLNLLVADPALSASIGRLDGITGNLLATTQGLNNTMNSQVPRIANNTVKLTQSLDTVVGNLGQLSYQLKSLPVDATLDNVNKLTENLAQFSKQLNDKNSTLGLLTSDPALYNQLNRVSADIDSLILDIKKNPKRYISIKLL
ncbi:MAG: MlaD family protein [Muribaculaceae bacterium]|nr:MlaD family protein [Muribaculaceae bacterium]MDE6522725.1 MlaD family protein [Muribaculaceae bacterium]